ncbi:hypothetical protein COU53_01065 [Candidatus Pacearchaeota archaeon CG10_big_fil_rev_8_21_14_0_10_30_48]|nr:MAG: hypothetical protein COU53_01065 [Candidatus Pacearchaeota archaeon CG10_big_fil_rev_8_21_14_0_10_30_48]
MKIIFICKHNVFRSRVAEAVFKKHYKGKKWKVKSRGTFPLNNGLKNTINAVKEIGYNIKGNPKGMTYEDIITSDLIVIVADDVPKKLFDKYKKQMGKLIVWKIPDTKQSDTGSIQKISRDIEKRVKGLVKTLK